DRRDELHVPRERRPTVKTHVLRHVADVALRDGLLARHRAAEHAHVALVLMHERHQDADRRRLTGAVRPDEAQDLPGLAREANVAQAEEAIRLVDAVHLNRELAHATSSVPGPSPALGSAVSRRRSTSWSVVSPRCLPISAAAVRCWLSSSCFSW